MSSRRVRPRSCWLFAAALVFVASEARADAILPYAIVPAGQIFLFPIVVLIEAGVFRWTLSGTVLGLLWQSFVANAVSAVGGFALQAATGRFIDDPVFTWWFKGGFGTEAIRNAIIALGYAAVLFAMSWAIEAWVISRLRKSASLAEVLRPCGWANFATYGGLLALALLFQN